RRSCRPASRSRAVTVSLADAAARYAQRSRYRAEKARHKSVFAGAEIAKAIGGKSTCDPVRLARCNRVENCRCNDGPCHLRKDVGNPQANHHRQKRLLPQAGKQRGAEGGFCPFL